MANGKLRLMDNIQMYQLPIDAVHADLIHESIIPVYGNGVIAIVACKKRLVSFWDANTRDFLDMYHHRLCKGKYLQWASIKDGIIGIYCEDDYSEGHKIHLSVIHIKSLKILFQVEVIFQGWLYDIPGTNYFDASVELDLVTMVSRSYQDKDDNDVHLYRLSSGEHLHSFSLRDVESRGVITPVVRLVYRPGRPDEAYYVMFLEEQGDWHRVWAYKLSKKTDVVVATASDQVLPPRERHSDWYDVCDFVTNNQGLVHVCRRVRYDQDMARIHLQFEISPEMNKLEQHDQCFKEPHMLYDLSGMNKDDGLFDMIACGSKYAVFKVTSSGIVGDNKPTDFYTVSELEKEKQQSSCRYRLCRVGKIDVVMAEFARTISQPGNERWLEGADVTDGNVLFLMRAKHPASYIEPKEPVTVELYYFQTT